MTAPLKLLLLLYLASLTLSTKTKPRKTQAKNAPKKTQKQHMKELRRQHEKMWEDYFKHSDKLVTSYNTLYDDDFLVNHMAETGSEVDPAYPEYFNENFSSERLSQIHRKTHRLQHRKFDNLGNPVDTVLPTRYECVKFKDLFADSCRVYRNLLQVEPNEATRRLKLVDHEHKTERRLRGVKRHPKRHIRAKKTNNKHIRKIVSNKHRMQRRLHKIADNKSRRKSHKHKRRYTRRLQGVPMPPIMVKPQMENSSITITTFGAAPMPQHNYIADPKKPKTSLIIPRFYISPRNPESLI